MTKDKQTPILPGATIGIVGGGQLGRMSAMAAAHMGYHVHIFSPEEDSPASQVVHKTTFAAYDDKEALEIFARSVDVITFEFENVPHQSLELLQQFTQVYPSPEVMRICRNRIREKTFVHSLGIGTAPFMAVHTQGELEKVIKKISIPSILKTTELGYDGKGQISIRSEKDIKGAFDSLRTPEAVLEGFVNFTMEISVIVARSMNGHLVTYVPVQNIHKNHILDTTIAPAEISDEVSLKAKKIAETIAHGLDLRGLLAIEMFVIKNGDVLVNELAPRPHNSGHWTMDAAVTSQFEQHIRAVCGLPLGDTAAHCPAVMTNLIGKDIDNLDAYLANPNAKIHLYGKRETRDGRKMGHVTILKN
jgi:5-(carboxyamino)imidazole ribonucleotide synthase